MTKVYTTQAQVDKDIKNGVLAIEGDVTFECSISILASIQVIDGNITAQDINAQDINARDINARDINARYINAQDIDALDITAGDITAGDISALDIKAGDIKAGDINAWDINAWDITAHDITAGDINAGDISALDINAGDIKAGDINAWDIQYYAFCSVYRSIKCKSIKAKREVHSEPICLDGWITYKDDKPETIQIGDRKYSKSEVEERLKGLKEIKEEL